MSHRHRSGGRSLALAGTVLVLALPVAASVARAQPAPSSRAVVLGRVREALLERIVGQTADLPWELRSRPEEAGRRDALGAIRRVARAEGASVALWFEEGDGVITVFVVEVEAARLFARRIEGGERGEVLSDSARLEAAGLVVRGALRDLADGGHIGVVVAVAASDAPRRARTRSSEPSGARAGPPVERPRTRFAAAAAWSVALDGHSPAGQQGPSGALALEHRWVHLELGFASSLGASLEDARTTVRLSRHAFRAGAGVLLEPAPALSLCALITAGALVLERATVVVADGVAATPETLHVLGLVGAAARMGWWPVEGVLGLELSLGLDLVPAAPVLGYRQGDAVISRNRLWLAQPWLGLAIAVRTSSPLPPAR